MLYSYTRAHTHTQNICMYLYVFLYKIINILASCSKNLSSKVLSPGLLPAPSNKALYSCLNMDQ